MPARLVTRLLLVAPLALAGLACGGGTSAAPEDGGVDAEPQSDAQPQDDAAPAACPLAPRKFWTWNTGVMPPADVQVQATCRAMSDHAYVFVADDVWGSHMTQAQVDAVVADFELHTPGDPAKGMWALDTETFGDPPDVDGEPRIFLVYFDIAGFGSYSFDGFFRDSDETTSSVSNHTEMLHLNATGSQAPDSDYMLGVVIHELVHLIAYRYDDAEEQWLSESLAEAAMTQGGYLTDLAAGRAYARDTARTPLVVRAQLDYGAAFLFGSYLAEQFGPALLQALVQDPAHGVASVDAQLAAASTTFREVFGDFLVATLLDQPGIGDGRFGYSSFDVSALGSETAAASDGQSHASDAKAWGARFLRFTPGGAGTLAVTLAAPDYQKLVVRSAVFDPAAPGSATVASHDLVAASTELGFTVGAGEVVDLVVGAYWGSSLASAGTASEAVSFSYTATYTP